jgi:Cu-Zn family superoxide dismutase
MPVLVPQSNYIPEKGIWMVVKRLLVVAGLRVVLGCSLPAQPFVQAKAGLKNKDGQVVGRATFRDAVGGVIVNVDIKGWSAGLHANHVHAVDKCEGPAFTPSGGLRIAAAR